MKFVVSGMSEMLIFAADTHRMSLRTVYLSVFTTELNGYITIILYIICVIDFRSSPVLYIVT